MPELCLPALQLPNCTILGQDLTLQSFILSFVHRVIPYHIFSGYYIPQRGLREFSELVHGMHRAWSSWNVSSFVTTFITHHHSQWQCRPCQVSKLEAQEFYSVSLCGPWSQFYTIRQVIWNPAVTPQEPSIYLDCMLSLLFGESWQITHRTTARLCQFPHTQLVPTFSIHCAVKRRLMFRNMTARPFKRHSHKSTHLSCSICYTTRSQAGTWTCVLEIFSNKVWN